jgi:hypothetical protein
VDYSNTAPVPRMLAVNAARAVFASLGASVAGPAGTIVAMAGRPAVEALASRSAAGRVALHSPLYWSDPAKRAAHGELTRQRMDCPAVHARISERTKAAHTAGAEACRSSPCLCQS